MYLACAYPRKHKSPCIMLFRTRLIQATWFAGTIFRPFCIIPSPGPNLLARSQNMWACVYTSAGACVGVFARARKYTCMSIVRVYACMCAHTYAYMSIVRVHACICRGRMHACTLCGRILACVCVHVRSVGARAHVCICRCVCAWACAGIRVHARVRVYVRSRAYVSQGACVSARARPYASSTCACGFSRGCARTKV